MIPKRDATKSGKSINNALAIVRFDAHTMPAHRHGRRAIVSVQAGICLPMNMVQAIRGTRRIGVDVLMHGGDLDLLLNALSGILY